MTIIKIPKECLITEDQNSITLNLPDDLFMVETKSIDYDKIAQVRGILKDKRNNFMNFMIYSQKVHQDWE